MTFAYLDQPTLDAVRQAAIDLGYATDSDLATLASGISPQFVGATMTGGNPLAKLYTFLGRMNTVRVLRSGEVPLRTWLTAAVMLAAGRPEEAVLRDALGRISADHTTPDHDVAALPRGDTGLEIAIGEDDTLDVSFLHQGSRAARAVAQVLVHRHFDGQPSSVMGGAPEYGQGTGWLIAEHLLITNHHVVRARAPLDPAITDTDFALQGSAVVVQFDVYGSGTPIVETHGRFVAGDQDLDFAILRLTSGRLDRTPLRLRPQPILRSAALPLKDRVNVLQHPNSRPMRIGFRNNFVVTGSDTKLSYLTDTAYGASGSPICDDAWYVAALHRGFAAIPEGPVSVWGRSISQENYGTPIGRILQHLAEHHPDLHAEIQAGQLIP